MFVVKEYDCGYINKPGKQGRYTVAEHPGKKYNLYFVHIPDINKMDFIATGSLSEMRALGWQKFKENNK